MFVEITNILEKRKKRNLIIAALFFVLINAFLPTFAVNNVIGNVTHQKKTSYTLQEKHQLFEGLGKELKPHGLRITPKEFADACMVALYCESNLKTTSVGDSGSQGINQLTAATIIFAAQSVHFAAAPKIKNQKLGTAISVTICCFFKNFFDFHKC